MMTWGLVEPNSFGEFFLNGNYTNWEESIKRHFDDNMTTEQREKFDNRHASYMAFVARKFSKNLGTVENYELPTEYKLIERCYFPASMVKLGSGLIAVEDELKEIIEKFEPNIHKFMPIKLIDVSGETLNKNYYLMIICSFIDAFIPDRSDAYRPDANLPYYYADDHTKKTYKKIFISNDKTYGYHLWRDVRLSRPSIFMSDELESKISKNKLRIFKHYSMGSL